MQHVHITMYTQMTNIAFCYIEFDKNNNIYSKKNNACNVCHITCDITAKQKQNKQRNKTKQNKK